MENQENQITTAELLVGVVSHQTQYMADALRFANLLKDYLHAARMMARVCRAEAPADSELERSAAALYAFLADLEGWAIQNTATVEDTLQGMALIAQGISGAFREQEESQTTEAQEG